MTADFTGVGVAQAGPDVVRVTGGSGPARITEGDRRYRAGWIDEARVSYRGPGAAERARLAGQIVLDRLEYLDIRPIETRAEVVNLDSLYPGSGPVTARAAAGNSEPYEARVRVATRVRTARGG